MTRKHKILVADDDRSVRELLRIALTRAGFEVVFAEDGMSAVHIAGSEKPDLALIDGLLPKLHGFLACKQIKALPSPPLVILFTGVYTKPTYRWEVRREYGADELITKPTDMQQLIATISRMLPGSTDSGPELKEKTAAASNRSEGDTFALSESETDSILNGFSTLVNHRR